MALMALTKPKRVTKVNKARKNRNVEKYSTSRARDQQHMTSHRNAMVMLNTM